MAEKTTQYCIVCINPPECLVTLENGESEGYCSNCNKCPADNFKCQNKVGYRVYWTVCNGIILQRDLCSEHSQANQMDCLCSSNSGIDSRIPFKYLDAPVFA